MYREFIKYCVFFSFNVEIFWTLQVLLQCTILYNSITQGKPREAKVRNIFLNLWKNTIFYNHPVYVDISHIKKNNKKGGCLNISTLSNMTALGSKPLPGLNKNIFKIFPKHLQILHQGRAQDLKIPGALRNLPGTL